MPSLQQIIAAIDRAADWVGLSKAPLNVDELIDSALRRTGRKRFRDETFMHPLRLLLDCYEHEADLNVFGRFAAKWDTLRCLENLVRFEVEEERQPQVLDGRIERPIFITGLPRSGTTFLHTLFGRDPHILMPHCWQTIFPYPLRANRRDTRRSRVENQLQLFQHMAPELSTLHPMTADSPQECTEITAQVFQSLRFEMTHRVPTYQKWMDASGHVSAYRFHKRFLQHLQHQNGEGRWVLKCPDHIHALDAIEIVYPDAVFVFVHRDPVRVIASAAKLTEVVRRPFTRRVDRHELGRQVVGRAIEAANIMVARSAEDEDRRIAHVHHSELAERPLETIERLYRRFGIELSETARRRMKAFISSLAQHANGHYSFDPFGLDPNALCAQFEPYVNYFSVRRESEAWNHKRETCAPIAA